MAKITLEINDAPNEYWRRAAIDWIVDNVDSLPQPLEKYANGEESVIEVLDAMYGSGTFEWFLMTTKDLQIECQKAAEKEFWEETMYRAYALFQNDKETHEVTLKIVNDELYCNDNTTFSSWLIKHFSV